jgi:hypothetical protein
MATQPSRKPKARKPTQGRWQAHPNDAIKLAALRWFALMTETQMIQAYATDTSVYETLCRIMRNTIKELEEVRKSLGDPDGDCPEGYVRCGRECAPMCDVID